MTKRPNPKNKDIGVLKTLLVVGSVAATLIGTRMIAAQDAMAETAVPEPEQIIIIEREPVAPLPMPPTSDSGQAIVLDLAPITQAVTPHINPVQVQQVQQAQQMQPVATTKSS